MSRYDSTAGPLFIGFCLSMILYGALVVQAFLYYQRFKTDKLWIRATVLYLLLMETAITGYNIGEKYMDDAVTFALASRERDAAAVGLMTHLSQMLSTNAVLTVLVSTPVQLFLAWRIKVLGGPKLVLGIIVFASLGSFVGGVVTSKYVPRGDEAEAIISLGWSSNLAESFAPEISWLAMSAIADICITGTLVYTLHTKKTGFRSTDDVVTKITRFAIETGLLTMICTIVEIILFIVANFTFRSYYFIPDFILSKVYANTLLATLNARSGWGNAMLTVEMSGVAFNSNDNSTFGQTNTSVVGTTSPASKHMRVHVRMDEVHEKKASVDDNESHESIRRDHEKSPV